MTKDTDEAWVLWIGYTDGSGESVVRVYSDETRALQDTDLLALAGSSKSFALKKVPVYSSHLPLVARSVMNQAPEPALPPP
jgi:hypothetical protein